MIAYIALQLDGVLRLYVSTSAPQSLKELVEFVNVL